MPVIQGSSMPRPIPASLLHWPSSAGAAQPFSGQARHPQVTHVACRFLVTYMCAPDGGQPALITDLMQDWPALERWQDLNYLSR